MKLAASERDVVYRAMLKHIIPVQASFFETIKQLLSPGLQLKLIIKDDDRLLAYVKPEEDVYAIYLGTGLAKLGLLIERVLNGAFANSLWRRTRFLWGSTFGVKPRNEKAWGALQLQLFGLAIEFVIAHEIGHVVAGHFEWRRKRAPGILQFSESFELAGGETDSAATELQAIELHADLTAGYLIRGAADVAGGQFHGTVDTATRREMSRFAAMCTVFFLATEKIQSVKQRINWAAQCHPHPLSRLMTLRNDIIGEPDERLRERAFERVVRSLPWVQWRHQTFDDLGASGAKENQALYNVLIDCIGNDLTRELGDYRARIKAISKGVAPHELSAVTKGDGTSIPRT